jgi:hypothetical protein
LHSTRILNTCARQVNKPVERDSGIGGGHTPISEGPYGAAMTQISASTPDENSGLTPTPNPCL